MTKPSQIKVVLLIAAIVIELASIIVIAKSTAKGTSPAVGIILLSMGVIIMVIALLQKPASLK